MTIASSVGGVILGENLYTLKLLNTPSSIVLPPNFTLECCHTLCSHHCFFVTFPLQTWLIFPSVFSSYCHLQTLVSCFSYHKEITPDAILCILYFYSLLQLILFSTSGRKNPWNMTVARFASILVTDHQWTPVTWHGRHILVNIRAGLTGIFREKTVYMHPWIPYSSPDPAPAECQDTHLLSYFRKKNLEYILDYLEISREMGVGKINKSFFPL